MALLFIYVTQGIAGIHISFYTAKFYKWRYNDWYFAKSHKLTTRERRHKKLLKKTQPCKFGPVHSTALIQERHWRTLTLSFQSITDGALAYIQYVYFPAPLTSFRMLGYRECRCEGFSADSLSHNSHQLRVTAAAARSLTKIRKLHSHVQRQATSSSTTSLSLLFIQFSALERERPGTVREGVWVRQITTDNRQLRPAWRHMNRLSSACQHNSKSNERTELLILSRNLHGGSVLAI